MVFRALADLVVALHLGFILFAALGALLALRWPKAVWLHVPAALWAATVELAGWTCPLTPLETRLREAAGAGGYSGGFVEHYLVPVVYPPGLTRDLQLALGLLVIGANVLLYAVVWRRARAHRRRVRAP